MERGRLGPRRTITCFKNQSLHFTRWGLTRSCFLSWRYLSKACYKNPSSEVQDLGFSQRCLKWFLVFQKETQNQTKPEFAVFLVCSVTCECFRLVHWPILNTFLLPRQTPHEYPDGKQGYFLLCDQQPLKQGILKVRCHSFNLKISGMNDFPFLYLKGMSSKTLF